MIEKYKDEDIPFLESEEFHRTYESVKNNPEALKELESIMDDVISRLKPLVERYEALSKMDNVDQEEILKLEEEKYRIEKERLERTAILLQSEVERQERIGTRLRAEIDRLSVRKEVGHKIYPNDPCPCGSGLKYKKCCGKK